MLFKINLNKLEDKSEAVRKRRMQGAALILIAVLFPLTALYTASQYNDLKKQSVEFEKKISVLEQEIESLEQEEDYIGKNEVLDLYDLTNERIFWSEKLEALSGLVNETIALTALNYHNEKLYINGITRAQGEGNQFSRISDFIDTLKSSPVFASDFKQINFLSSERKEFMNRNIVSFEIVCLKNRK